MNLSIEIDFNAVREQVASKYITVRKHPFADLFIYNYTPRAMYEGYWTPETMACRGLIANGQDRIVARPFRKFFNVSELEVLPSEPFGIYDKLDGSLCISYQTDGQIRLATRGSFESEQAGWANEIFRSKYSGVELDTERFTYLW